MEIDIHRCDDLNCWLLCHLPPSLYCNSGCNQLIWIINWNWWALAKAGFCYEPGDRVLTFIRVYYLVLSMWKINIFVLETLWKFITLFSKTCEAWQTELRQCVSYTPLLQAIKLLSDPKTRSQQWDIKRGGDEAAYSHLVIGTYITIELHKTHISARSLAHNCSNLSENTRVRSYLFIYFVFTATFANDSGEVEWTTVL